MMISMDNPEHQRRRSLVNRGFSPRRIAELEGTVAGLCRRIIDRICESGQCDFVWDVAAPLPLMVIADLLGFDEAMHADLLKWFDDILRATTLELTRRGCYGWVCRHDGISRAAAGGHRGRREHPRDDLISTLCTAWIDGHGLDDESIVNETLLILIGGDETTRHVISGGMLRALERPEHLVALAAQPELLQVAVEELLRWVSPVKNMARTVTKDVELRGQLLGAGDQLMLLTRQRTGTRRSSWTPMSSTYGAIPTRIWRSASNALRHGCSAGSARAPGDVRRGHRPSARSRAGRERRTSVPGVQLRERP